MPRQTRGDVGASCEPARTTSPRTAKNQGGERSRAAMTGSLEKHLVKTELCRYHVRNGCRHGSNCPFAHEPSELRKRPDLRKTLICPAWLRGRCHKSSQECSYAHGEDELRTGEKANPLPRRGRTLGAPDSKPVPNRDGGFGEAERRDSESKKMQAGQSVTLCLHAAFDVGEGVQGFSATWPAAGFGSLSPTGAATAHSSFPMWQPPGARCEQMVPHEATCANVVPFASQSGELREMLQRLLPGSQEQLLSAAEVERLLIESRPECYQE